MLGQVRLQMGGGGYTEITLVTLELVLQGRLVREELFENESIRGEKWTGKLETRRNSIREMGEKWETIRNSRREMGVNGKRDDTRYIIFQR